VSPTEVAAVVVGAGIAGLAAALELQTELSEVIVVDALDRPGGVMRTDHVSGYCIERGPNTFQVKPPMLEFIRGHVLEPELHAARPESRARHLLRDGKLVQVPMSMSGFAKTPLLSRRAKLRLLAEPLIPRRDPGAESVAEFTRRRLGREVADNLVGPFLTGVYAGNEQELGADAVFPALTEFERRRGSIFLGQLGNALSRGRPRGLSGTWSGVQGMGPFARQLAERLRDAPTLETDVSSIHHDGVGWNLSMHGPGGALTVRTEKVVIATPARGAAEMLRGVSSELPKALEEIDYAPIVGMAVGVDPKSSKVPIEGFGFLVPRAEELGLLGCLFMSSLFPGRAPEGRELLHCIVGGTRWREAVELPADVLREQIFDELEGSLGLREEPELVALWRVPRAVPQPGRNHLALRRVITTALKELPGVRLAGGYLDGVSVADSLASGVRAARTLLV